MTRAMKYASILLLAMVIITGCSPEASSPTPPPFPTGAFENGEWSWEFKADGTFLSSGPIGSETGTYQVNGNQVTIACECCGDAMGTYTWAFDGSELSFTAVEDPCSNRSDVVDGSTWL